MLEISLRICCCTFCTRRGFAHSRSGVIAVRGALVCEWRAFFVPRAEGRREGGAHGGDAQGGTAVQRRAGASARCLRGGTHIRSAGGGASRGQHARDRRHRVTCPRVQTKVRCCLPRSSENGPGAISREDCRFGQPAANYFRETPDADSRAHLTARAWGRRRVLPARTVTLSRRAPSSGVSGPACEPQEESKASPLSETQRTFGPKTGRFLTRRAESATMSSMTNTRSERVDAEAMTPPSSTRRPGVAGESFGDVSLGSARTPRPNLSPARADC